MDDLALADSFRGLRILMTGASGFIGDHLARRLTHAGAIVYGLDVRPSSSFSGKRFFRGDVRDLDLEAFSSIRPHFVFHLASVVGVSAAAADPESTRKVIVGGTERILDLATRSGVPKFVFLSSSEVYGEPKRSPVTEESPHAPLSAYGKAKSDAERMVDRYVKEGIGKGVIIRPFNVYGPGQRTDFVIPRFISMARKGHDLTVLGDGQQLRTFTYIDDLVHGVLLASIHVTDPFHTFNISGTDVWSLQNVAALIAKHFGGLSRVTSVDAQALGRPASIEVRHRVASHSLATRVLGYSPRFNLARGIQKLALACPSWIAASPGAVGLSESACKAVVSSETASVPTFCKCRKDHPAAHPWR
jgi:nucleoside-diphosphate-sugar epimerase